MFIGRKLENLCNDMTIRQRDDKPWVLLPKSKRPVALRSACRRQHDRRRHRQRFHSIDWRKLSEPAKRDGEPLTTSNGEIADPTRGLRIVVDAERAYVPFDSRKDAVCQRG